MDIGETAVEPDRQIRPVQKTSMLGGRFENDVVVAILEIVEDEDLLDEQSNLVELSLM